MRFLFDLFPVILFFVAYQWAGIYWATATAMVASVVQIGGLLVTKRRVEPAAWISLGVITVFGGVNSMGQRAWYFGH